jgi:hypothetical protein
MVSSYDNTITQIRFHIDIHVDKVHSYYKYNIYYN